MVFKDQDIPRDENIYLPVKLEVILRHQAQLLIFNKKTLLSFSRTPILLQCVGTISHILQLKEKFTKSVCGEH